MGTRHLASGANRSLLCVVGFLSALLIPGCGSKAAKPAGPDLSPELGTRTVGVDWATFLGPSADGTSPERGLITPWPAQGPAVLWQEHVEAGYTMPAINHGRLYLFERRGDANQLRCLRSETKELLWRFEYPTNYQDFYGYNNGPRCFPIVDEDRVYIYGQEGMLHCLGALDGKVRWSVDTHKQFGMVQNFFGVGSTPVIEGDLLIAQVGGSPPEDDTTPPLAPFRVHPNGSGVVAFDKRTGAVIYQIINDLASYASPKLATINGRRWCFVLARGGLYGFDPANGKLDFQLPWKAKAPESVNAATPVVVGDRVFISEAYGPGGALLKVRPGGFEVLWSDADKPRRKSMQCHWATPIYHNGYLYGCSGRYPGEAELRCIEMATGKVMWSVPRLSRTTMLMADGHLICLTEDGLLLLVKVNPQKYEEVSRVDWRRRGHYDLFTEAQVPIIEHPCWSPPVLSHGLLYVRGKDRLLCLEVIPDKGVTSGPTASALQRTQK